MQALEVCLTAGGYLNECLVFPEHLTRFCLAKMDTVLSPCALWASGMLFVSFVCSIELNCIMCRGRISSHPVGVRSGQIHSPALMCTTTHSLTASHPGLYKRPIHQTKSI